MKFGEKVRAARLAAKYSQRQLADMTGIALRTIQNYESGERLPKQKENYQLLATALNVDVDALKDDDADFVIKATEKYGARGNAQAERLVKEVSGLYAGGELAEEDMDAMMKAIQEAYWIEKKRTGNMYRKNTEASPVTAPILKRSYRKGSDFNNDQ